MLYTRDGKVIPTESDAAMHFNVATKTIRNWINKGIIPLPPEEAYGTRWVRTFPKDYLNEAKIKIQEYRKLRGKANKNDENLGQDLRLKVEEITDELICYLKRHPEYLTEMNARNFEKLVAEIVSDMGYDVELTPASRDGGRDILAYMSTPLGKELTIIECKRFNQKRKVGIELVRQFLWVLERGDKANRGLIAATSYFTSEAYILQKKHKWRLQLKDFNHINDWLSQYGTWEHKNASGLWLPNRDATV